MSDELSVEVRNLGQPEFSFDVKVPRNGRISIPLLGEIMVRGHTIQQTEILLESRLRDGYLKQPEVTIRVTEYRPFFIDGAVESPGAYPFQHGLTVEKAIVLAGGLSES
ncbi:polysaccharide biosynthesis/export family protein, partial [Gammaproteobacteria bacterium]|nr:polysaccharide biosynthesis/export family protein [Gammaproteobacteria bacterium]